MSQCNFRRDKAAFNLKADEADVEAEMQALIEKQKMQDEQMKAMAKALCELNKKEFCVKNNRTPASK